jgi:hypothetical protein
MMLEQFRTLIRHYAPELAAGVGQFHIYTAVKEIAERCKYPEPIRREDDMMSTLERLWMHIENNYLPAKQNRVVTPPLPC